MKRMFVMVLSFFTLVLVNSIGAASYHSYNYDDPGSIGLTNDSDDFLIFTLPMDVDVSKPGVNWKFRWLHPKTPGRLNSEERDTIRTTERGEVFDKKYMLLNPLKIEYREALVSDYTKPEKHTENVQLDDNSRKLRLFVIHNINIANDAAATQFQKKLMSGRIHRGFESWDDSNMFPSHEMSVLEYELPKKAKIFIYNDKQQLISKEDNKVITPRRKLSLVDWLEGD